MKKNRSFSALLGDPGIKMRKINRQEKRLTDPTALKRFFRNYDNNNGEEPDWEDHKRLILNSHPGEKNHDLCSQQMVNQ